MSDVDDRIAALAANQHGAFSLQQLFDSGGTRDLAYRRCRQGRWRRVAAHVFVMAGTPKTFGQRVKVAELAGGPGSLVSHRTGCHFHGLDGYNVVPIEVSVLHGRQPRPPASVIVHESLDLHLAAPTTIDSIAVTGLARTLLDLGAVAPHRVAHAVDSARRHHALPWDDLLEVLIEHAKRGRRGVGPLRQVLGHHYGDPRFDSRSESTALRIVRDAHVTEPVLHHRVVAADGRTVELDLAWPPYWVGAEIDGLDHLAREQQMHKDRRKWNQLRLAGWDFVVYTGRMLREGPDRFAADVRAMLTARGWPGPPVLPAQCRP